MPKILLVGIDGLDWSLLKSMMSELPAINSIAQSGFADEMPSIFPPDSIPSWISIFTGMDPSEHGILDSVDYFKKSYQDFSVDTSAFRGKTFWDIAGSKGKRVIVVNPFMAYPPWPVNGIMSSGPVFLTGETKTFSDSNLTIDVPPLGGIVGFPKKRELVDFYENTKSETSSIVEYTCNLMQNSEWDLTFLTLLTVDRICHFYWRYYDKYDPTYPGPSKLSAVVPDFLRFIDSCVKKLVDSAGQDTIVMLVSDHGHAMRPPYFFNLNQLLMESGYLISKAKKHSIPGPRLFIEKAKDFALETLHRFDLEDFSYAIAKLFPFTRSIKSSDFMTNPDLNIATASSFGGSNSFGGISVSKEACLREGLDYEFVRSNIIKLLLSIIDDNGALYFEWAKRREDIYNGNMIHKYPDILYMLREELGTNWSLHLPLVTINPRHNKISGGHRTSSVVVAGPLDNYKCIPNNISSINICSTILFLLGCNLQHSTSCSFIKHSHTMSSE